MEPPNDSGASGCSSYHFQEDMRLLALHGTPGPGQSVVSGYAVRFLEETGLNCSFQLSKQGNQRKPSLSAVLVSSSFQMARSGAHARTFVLVMITSDERLNLEGHDVACNHLFMGKIFKPLITSPRCRVTRWWNRKRPQGHGRASAGRRYRNEWSAQ